MGIVVTAVDSNIFHTMCIKQTSNGVFCLYVSVTNLLSKFPSRPSSLEASCESDTQVEPWNPPAGRNSRAPSLPAGRLHKGFGSRPDLTKSLGNIKPTRSKSIAGGLLADDNEPFMSISTPGLLGSKRAEVSQSELLERFKKIVALAVDFIIYTGMYYCGHSDNASSCKRRHFFNKLCFRQSIRL